MTSLINAPTIATIDASLLLTINWQPIQVAGAYAAYAGWNIGLGVNGGTPTLQSYGEGLPTGLEIAGATADSRIFEEQVPVAATYSLTMDAVSAAPMTYSDAGYWTNPLFFPTLLAPSSVVVNNATPQLGQSILISLAGSYTGATSWRVVFPDGTSTAWLPLSIRAVAKAFATPGVQNLLVQVQNDFSSLTPAVQLRAELAVPVYVGSQQYAVVPPAAQITGTLGVGGSAGYEIIGLTSPSTVLAPYELIVRALVRETTTNELKLLVGTSRTPQASSLLGTMALDVFPIVGRPHTKELVKAILYLDTTANTSTIPVHITTGTAAGLALPASIIGKTFLDFPLQAVGGTGPYTWYSQGLPSGLSMSIDGTISGTAAEMGSFQVSFAVMDASVPAFIDETTLTMVVGTDLLITTATLPTATVNTPYSFPMNYTGGLQPVTWSIVSGALPIGLSIDPNLGVISGTPCTYNSTTDFSKTYTCTVQVTDSVGAQASNFFTIALAPAALQFGPVDQPIILATESALLVVPVFGGQSPYTLSSFADNGVVGSGPEIASPQELVLVAGVAPATLVLTTPNQQFFPSALPAMTPFPLTASGGTPPYAFTLGTGTTTLPTPSILGDALMLGGPASAGTYAVSITVTDGEGVVTPNNPLSILVQQQNASPYTVKPVSVALNSSTDPASWTVTPLTALPDAVQGTAYQPAAGACYGLALYNGGTLQMSQVSGGSGTPMDFNIATGSLPTGLTTFTNSAFGGTGDHSGIVLFNYTGPQYIPSGDTVVVVEGSGSFTTDEITYWNTSFLVEVSNIYTGSAYVLAAARQSLTVVIVPTGLATPVVVVTSVIPLTITSAQEHLALIGGLPSWAYPLVADGGTGPYIFTLQTGTTLPGAILNLTGAGVYEISSSTFPSPGTYIVNVQATDQNGVLSAIQPITFTVTP